MNKTTSMLAFAILTTTLFAQDLVKPPVSETKIEKVLVYEKIGGWRHNEGIPAVNQAVQALGNQYGFDVTITDNESSIEINFLSDFQVVIWNNNTDGGASLQSGSARNALLQYINNGGGYLPIHGAGDHGDTWTQLRDLIGTNFTRHGDQGNGTLAWDQEALDHDELSIMLDGHDPSTLFEEWYSFQNSPRGLDGFTIIASVSGAGNIVVPLQQADPNGVNPAVWAKDEGNNKGKVLYTAIGHRADIFTQEDDWGRAFLWDNMRYVANDFNLGCTDSEASNFDEEARVDDDSCEPVGVHINGKKANPFGLAIQSGMVSLNLLYDNPYTVRMVDARGLFVFEESKSQPWEFEVRLTPGIYLLSVERAGTVRSTKIVVL